MGSMEPRGLRAKGVQESFSRVLARPVNEKEYSLSIRACVRGGVMRRHSKKRQASACYRLRGKKQPYIVVIIGIYDSFALLKVSIPG